MEAFRSRAKFWTGLSLTCLEFDLFKKKNICENLHDDHNVKSEKIYEYKIDNNCFQ